MPLTMPSGKKCAVCLAFDVDSIASHIHTFRLRTPAVLSRGEFGPRVGMPRILDLLDKYDIKTTFFIPGLVIDTYPELAKDVLDRGHEIGWHGYCHESPLELTYEEERDALRRGIDSIKRISRAAPLGYRSPICDSSPNTVKLVLEHGFLYTSYMFSDDFRPIKHRIGDVVSPTGFKFGEETSLIDITMCWTLVDTNFLEVGYPSFFNNIAQSHPPSSVLEVWKEEFNYMYDNVPGGVYTTAFHPFCIGHGSRMIILEKLIQHIRAHQGVWFARCMDVAKAWKE